MKTKHPTMHRTAVRPGDIVIYEGDRWRVIHVVPSGESAYLQARGWTDLPESVQYVPQT